MAKHLKRLSLQLKNRQQMSLQLESLPDEVLLIVFSYLKIQELLRCSRVSKRIGRICHDKSLWKKIDLSNMKVKAEFIKAILENDCENLNLQNSQIVGSIQLSKTSKLMHLNLTTVDYGFPSVFHEILLSCCSLQKLMLEFPFPNKILSKLLDTALQKFCSQNGKTLRTLNICLLNWLSTKSLQVIVMQCAKLQEISFEYLKLDQNALNQIVTGLTPGIEKVSLAGNKELTDEHIETLVSRCNKITALDISGIRFLTNNVITSIWNHLKLSLRELDITACPNIELEKVLELESLPKLKVLNYGSYPLDEMPALRKKLPHLMINKKIGLRIAQI